MDTVGTEDKSFDERKRAHLEHALNPAVQALELRDLDQVSLIHEALPEVDLRDIQTSSSFFGRSSRVPFFISSMTAGHDGSVALNQLLAQSAQDLGWAMGVGSQRKQLFDGSAKAEWKSLRKSAPRATLFGNIGIAQLIETTTSQIQELAESIEASAFIVHLNALQECIQPEGTPNFKGGFKALQRVVKELSMPVIVKETGCGFSESTLQRLRDTGVAVIDISGAGGTHWGRVEGARSQSANQDLYRQASKTYGRWGIGTVESLYSARAIGIPTEQLWASGGVQNGLDAAKLLAVGASKVGFAKAALAHAVHGETELRSWMQQMEYELKIALFCTGSENLNALSVKKVWRWNSKSNAAE